MASDRRSERSALRGLLVPDVGLTFDTAESTLTQAGARAGLPSPDRRTTTALVATGEQSATLGVEVLRGGAIGAGLDTGATFAFERDGVSYGWDQPTALRGWEGVTSDANPVVPQDLVALGDTLISAVTVTAVSSAAIEIYSKTAGSAWTLAKSIGAFGSGSTISACLVPLPTGRLLVFHHDFDGAVFVTFSDDRGDTWSSSAQVHQLDFRAAGVGASGYLESVGMTGVYSNGQILLIVNVQIADTLPGTGEGRYGFLQLASTDLGNSFSQVTTSNFSTSLSWDCGAGGRLVVTKAGTILFAFVSSAANPCISKICRLATAFSPFNAEEVDLTTDVPAGTSSSVAGVGISMVDWDCALAVADDGTVWAYLRDDQITYPFRSEDDGLTWSSQGTTNNVPSLGSVYYSDSADSRWKDSHACAWRGGVTILHGWDADSGAWGGLAAGVGYLGGWADIVFASDVDADSSDRWSFDRTWLPLDDPGDVGWTKTGAGTVTLSATQMNLTTSTQTLSYSYGVTGRPVAVRATVRTAAGGVGSKAVFVGALSGSGSFVSEVELRIGTTSVVVYDSLASSVKHTFTIDATEWVDILLFLDGSAITVAVALASVDGPRAYTTYTGSLLQVLGATTSQVSWGHGALSTADSYWRELHFASDYSSFWDTIPEHGAPLSHHAVFVDSGVSVRAEGGPAWAGDSWSLSPRYDFGIERIDAVDSPSPRRGWRSTSDAADVELAWTWNSDHDPGHLMGALVGIGLFNVNFSNFTVQTLDSMGAWNSLTGEVSSSEPDFSSMDVSVVGHTVAPLGTSSPKPFLKLNELKGASLYLGAGCVRRIKSNSAGRWSTGAGQQARIILESVDGTEPSTSTTASVIPRDFVLVTRLPSTEIRGIRLLIEGQDTAEGHFEIGSAVIGHVEIFADEYGWGRTIDLEPSVERTVLRGGTSRTRVLAPPKRRITFAWEEPVDTTMVEGSEPEPDYLTSSSTTSSPAVASIGATPSQVYGLVSLLDSGKVPVVYLPSIPIGSTGQDTAFLNRRDEMLLAQAVSSVSLETVLGEECSTEMVRVASVVLEEVT